MSELKSGKYDFEDACAEELQAIVRAMPDACFVLDRAGNYCRVLTQREELLASPPEELLASTVEDQLPPEPAQKCLEGIERTLATGEVQEIEYTLDVPASQLHFNVHISPLDEERVVFVARDVTEFEETEAELRSANQQLDASNQQLRATEQQLRAEVEERKRTEDYLKQKLALEKIVTGISARFVRDFDLDEAINKSLAEIGELSEADRAYVFLFRDGGDTMDNTHEWCAAGVQPQIDNLQELSTSTFPWWMERLRRNETIQIEDISAMPEEARTERKILEEQDIKSVLVFPLNISGELAGYIGYDNVAESNSWDAEDLSLLNMVSRIFGNAIERKQSEEYLQAALEEKELLLREVHHRVKNNMQLISSMLNMQARTVEGEQAREKILDSGQRVRSLALIHEKLYRSEEIAELKTEEYITELVQGLIRSNHLSGINVKFHCEIDSGHDLDLDKSIYIGLIINELVSNALDHAVDNQKETLELEVRLTVEADNYQLQVADNGRGLPADFEFGESGELGLQLVKTLGEQQLNGQVKIDATPPGTTFNISIPRGND